MRCDVCSHLIELSPLSVRKYTGTVKFLLFAVAEMDETQASGMSAEDVATEVLNAVALQRNEVLVAPFVHRAVTYLRNFMPDTICREMARRAARQLQASRKRS